MSLILHHSPRLRYATAAMLYFAQGIPQGLLAIAMPAWLASQGVEAGVIASYLAIIVLPWAFKLVTGPLMDRYGFPPMGGRRPWILAAQFGMVLSLLGLAAIDDPVSQMSLLMALGALVNVFAATQDVAVDGMAIDLVPEQEHGRINAFMTCGKAIGWAATSAASGILLVNYGLATTAVLAAAVAMLVWVVFLFVREREGERLLPWSRGEHVPMQAAVSSFQDVKRGLNKVLWTRASLVIMVIMFLDGLIFGYGQALMPIAAIKVFNYSTEQWSQLVATMGLVGALLALLLGPIIDRIGVRQVLMLTVLVIAAHAMLLGNTQHLWNDSGFVQIMLSVWVLMSPVSMVCGIALAMSICSSGVSATQFAIYMSVANLGHSAGSKLFGLVSDHAQLGYAAYFVSMSALVAVLFVAVALFRKQDVVLESPVQA
jgi:PAT family beta-lactamase induction signal transducer AmpG